MIVSPCSKPDAEIIHFYYHLPSVKMPEPISSEMKKRDNDPCRLVRQVNHFFLKIAFGIIPCTPRVPSTSWVMQKSTPTLVSM